MLDTIKQYIADLSDVDFNTYYQNYVCNVQDENIGLETSFSDNTFNNIGKLIARIQKELGNIQ